MNQKSVNSSIFKFGGALATEQRPTVTYDPLQGQAFVRRLVAPMSVDTLILLIRSGWRTDRVLRMMVQQVNGVENARSASGPTPDVAAEYSEFLMLSRTLRQLQLGGNVRIGYETNEKLLSGAIDPDDLKAADFVDAAKSGWTIQPRRERMAIAMNEIEEGAPKIINQFLNKDLLLKRTNHIQQHGLSEPFRVRFDEDRKKFILQNRPIDFRAAQDAKLDLVSCIVEDPSEYFLTSPSQSLILSWDVSRVPTKDKQPTNPYPQETLDALEAISNLAIQEGRYELKIEPRSLLGSLYYLSHAIHVPQEHVEQGLVTTTFHEWGEPLDWNDVTGDLLQVCCQKRKPKAAVVSVKYRGYWFYIPDSHLSSKSTFTLLLQLFELQAGGGAEGAKPVLTLSVGR
jgi:hypothetical protein